MKLPIDVCTKSFLFFLPKKKKVFSFVSFSFSFLRHYNNSYNNANLTHQLIGLGNFQGKSLVLRLVRTFRHGGNWN